MSITFHFRPKENLVICVHAGPTPGDEFLASYKSLYKNHLFHTSGATLAWLDLPADFLDNFL